MSPRQAVVIPVNPKYDEYATQVIHSFVSCLFLVLLPRGIAGIYLFLGWLVMCLSVFSQVSKEIQQSDFMVEVNLDHGETLNKKIRNAQLAQFNFILGKKLMLVIF